MPPQVLSRARRPQETLYRNESRKRRLRRTAPRGPFWMATQARPAHLQRYSRSSIACRSTWQSYIGRIPAPLQGRQICAAYSSRGLTNALYATAYGKRSFQFEASLFLVSCIMQVLGTNSPSGTVPGEKLSESESEFE